jgi:Yip1 domain
MTNPTTDAGATVAPMGLLSRFIGVITSPKSTFQAVAAHPRWFGMLALVTLVVAIFVSLPLTTEAGRQAALDSNVRQMENFGVQVNDQMYANMAKSMRFAVYQTFFSILCVGPIISVIVAGILYGVFAVLMGGQATFKQLFAVYVHSTVISAAGQLFTGPLNYFRGSMTSATNLAVMLPMIDEHSFIGRLLGMIDLFLVWWLVLLAIGLGVLYRRRTQPIAIGLFAVYVVIILAAAAVMSAFGRTN